MKQENKCCKKCGVTKPIDDFYVAKRNEDGSAKYMFSYCKSCEKIKCKEYEKNEKDRKRLRNKKWRDENKEKIKEYFKKYRVDKEKIKERTRKFRTKYPERSLLSRKKQIENLTDGYISGGLVNLGFSRDQIEKYPELIETKRLIIKTKRLCKTLQNSEKA